MEGPNNKEIIRPEIEKKEREVNWLATDGRYPNFYNWHFSAQEKIPSLAKITDTNSFIGANISADLDQMKIGAVLLLNEMRESIESGEYAVVLGEDSTGRLPTLLLSKIIKRLYAERGLPPLRTRFFAGLSGDIENADPATVKAKWEDGIRAFLENVKSQCLSGRPNSRVLVCTEFISRGTSVSNISHMLSEAKIPHDIAAFSSRSSGESIIKDSPYIGKVFIGSFGEMDEGLRGNYWLTGIYKEQGDVHSRRYTEETGHTEHTAENLRDTGISNKEAKETAHQVVNFLAEKIADAYLAKDTLRKES